MIEVWSEGYMSNGDYAYAHRLGTFDADTFDEAVEMYIAAHPDEARLFQKSKSGIWTCWGCRLFDNEFAARVAFG